MTEFKPNPSITLDVEQERLWSNVIGGIILNFGGLEFVSLRWVRHFSHDELLNDMAIDLTFSKRLQLIERLIERTPWTADRKARADKLWREAEKLSKIRNTIAHNPLVFHNAPDGKQAAGVLTVKQMKGSGPFSVRLLDLAQIHSTALRLAALSRELTSLLVEIDGTNPDSAMSNPLAE